MANEWREVPFTEAVVVNPSVTLERGTEYPFVDMQALIPGTRSVHANERRTFQGGGSRFADGDTLMARITPCLENGKIARFSAAGSESLAHGSTEFIVIRGRQGVSRTDYAHYLTTWDAVRGYAVEQMTGTSGRQRVPTDSLNHLLVPIPSVTEQGAIAHILGTLDDKVELNRRRSRTLEAMARAIFQSWFVDFDPVTAKAEGRTPPGLSPALAALFPDRFEDSPLGPIPAGWQVWSLPEMIDVNPQRRLSQDALAPYLDMARMPTEGPTPGALVMRRLGSGMKFVNGDTLVARITPCLENGKTAFVDSLPVGATGWGSTEYIVLRPKGAIPPVFAYLLARSSKFRAFAIQQMTGSSGRQRVPTESLSKHQLALPSLDAPLFKGFGSLVEPFFARISASAAESRSLTALRDTLLPKLVSGELRVSVSKRTENTSEAPE